MTQAIDPPVHDLLVRDGAVLAAPGASAPLAHHDVAVDGTRITAVGPTGSIGAGQTVVNARGKAVLPGLVNCHSHAPMSLFRGTADPMPLQPWLAHNAPYAGRFDEEDVYWGALLAACQMLRAGVTTFADMYHHQALVIPALEQIGIRAFLAEGVMEASQNLFIGSVEDQLERADTLVHLDAALAGGRIVAGIAPHSVYTCSGGLLREVAEMARDAGCRVHTHVSETRREVEECEAVHGRRPPGYLAECGIFDNPTLAAHAVHLDAEDIALLAERGVAVAHNPASNLKLRSGLAPVPALLEAGVRVGLGTDGAGSNDSLDMWRDCYLAAVLHPWADEVSPAAMALELATAGGAAALGMDSEIGAIAVGMKADLAVIDLERTNLVPALDATRVLAFAARGDEVDEVVVDGRVVVMEGRVLGVNEAEVIEQCRRRARRIFEQGAVA